MRSAADQFHPSQAPLVRSAISDIIETLADANDINTQGSSSLQDIVSNRRCLSSVQQTILDNLWRTWVHSESWPKYRVVAHMAAPSRPIDVLTGLSGDQIYETRDNGALCYALAAHGALLTEQGPVLAELLTRFARFIADVYRDEPATDTVELGRIAKSMKLRPEEVQMLFRFLRLALPHNMPFRLAGWNQYGDNWSVRITDEVIELATAERMDLLLGGLFVARSTEDAPISEKDRMERLLFEALGAPAQSSVKDFSPEPAHSTGNPALLSSPRLESLKNLRNSTYDCTRLVCMCEEFNQCATRGNAHATIMLTRAILDHVPPIFGFRTFAEVANSYGGGGRSFKKSMARLEDHARSVADRLLHTPIRAKEEAPTATEGNFAQELECLLTEICRRLK